MSNTNKAAALIAFNMRQPIRGAFSPEQMARKKRMNRMLSHATDAFWTLDFYSAFEVWIAASADDCRAFSQDMNEHITECFYQK